MLKRICKVLTIYKLLIPNFSSFLTNIGCTFKIAIKSTIKFYDNDEANRCIFYSHLLWSSPNLRFTSKSTRRKMKILEITYFIHKYYVSKNLQNVVAIFSHRYVLSLGLGEVWVFFKYANITYHFDWCLWKPWIR